MQLVVCLARVMDPAVALEVQAEPGRVTQKEPRPVHVVNPADRVALELAMQLRQRRPGSHLTVVTCGPSSQEAALHYGLARGADAAVRIWDPGLAGADALTVAEMLARCLRRLVPDLVLCGNRTLDYGTGLVGPAIAGYLDLPQMTGVERIELEPDGRLRAWRRLDRGAREVLLSPLPAVLVVEPGAVTPHYVSVLSQLRARKQPVRVLGGAELGGLPAAAARTVQVTPPKPRTKRVILADSKASATDRMKALMGGGKKPTGPAGPATADGNSSAAGSGKGPLELPPEQAADQILQFLKARGLALGGPKS